MKKATIAGAAFLGLLFVHLLLTILFLFLPSEPVTKAMWLSVLLLLAGGSLAALETFLTRADLNELLSDTDLAQFFLLKGTISSLLAAASLNTFVYILNVALTVPLLITGLSALAFAAVCIANVIRLLMAQRSDTDYEDDYEEEPEEEQA